MGPATLKLRSDIPLEASTVTTVKHGERVDIIQRRRRFMRVRTSKGIEGWTHERQLLSTDEMSALEALTKSAARMPVQGQATSFESLNIHTLPNRLSPSFEQMKEKEKVDVLAHITAPRKEVARKPLLPPPPPKKAKAPAKPPKEPKYPPPPMPEPPHPPANWLELSKTDLSADDPDPEQEAEPEPPQPEPVDRWTLVRLPNGQAGWALTGRLIMAIPDEVAQYAEGRRIVSYFPLGEMQDGDQKKTIWLWTTIGGGVQPYDFDSFRVFVWSLRRHRYETAHIERNLRGYSPVRLEKVEMSSGSGVRASTERYQGFSVCVEKSDGQRYRRSYALLTNIVRFAGEQPCEAAPQPWRTDTAPQAASSSAASAAAPAAASPRESAAQKLRRQLETLYHRFRGK